MQGHHKPTYKHPKVSQKCGPYTMHRVNSLHSTSSAGNVSVDNFMHAGNGSDSQGSRSPASSGMGESQRCAKSEAPSPLLTGTSTSFAQLNGQLPPLDLSGIKYPPYVPNSADFFGNISDHEQPIFSAGLSAEPVDWSHYDIGGFSSKAEFAPSSYSQPQSYSGYDFTSSEQVPTLTTTTSTSGDASEGEDILSNPLEDFDTGYRNSATGSGFLNHASLLGSTDLSSLDFDDFRFPKTGNKYLPAVSSGDEPTLLTSASTGFGGFASLEDDPAYWMHDYSGLPNLTDSPTESNLPQFWDGQ